MYNNIIVLCMYRFSVIATLVVAVIMSTCGPLCCILMCYCIFRINKVCRQRNEFLASQQARSVTDTPSVLPLEQVNTMDMVCESVFTVCVCVCVCACVWIVLHFIDCRLIMPE